MRKALVFLGISLLAMSAFAAPAAISIGWSDYPPYQISASSGLDVELAQAVFTKAGYAPAFQLLPWARQLSGCESGSLDVVMVASKTDERAKYADWTLAYRQERNDLLCLVSSKAAPGSLKSLIGAGVKIGVQRDSYFGPDFEALSKDQGFQALLSVASDTGTNITMLEAGRLDFVIDDIVAARYAIKAKGLPTDVRVALPVYGDDVFFMISKKSLAKDPTLMDKVNKAITLLSGDGTFKAIFTKYGMVK